MKRWDLSFTLVEVILALAILGVGLVGILSVFAAGTNSVRRAVAITEAGLIAQMVFSDYRAKGYSEVNSEDDKKILNSDGEDIYPDYLYSTDVRTEGGVVDLKRVDLVIKYKNKDLLNFTTYISKYVP